MNADKGRILTLQKFVKIGHIVVKSKQSLRFDEKNMLSGNCHFFRESITDDGYSSKQTLRFDEKNMNAEKGENYMQESRKNSSDNQRNQNNHCDLTRKLAFQKLSIFLRKYIGYPLKHCDLTNKEFGKSENYT